MHSSWDLTSDLRISACLLCGKHQGHTAPKKKQKKNRCIGIPNSTVQKLEFHYFQSFITIMQVSAIVKMLELGKSVDSINYFKFLTEAIERNQEKNSVG